MKNITLSLQQHVLKAGRMYAKQHNLSLNALVRKLLEKTVLQSSNQQWLEDCLKLMDKANATSSGKKWKREDLYDV